MEYSRVRKETECCSTEDMNTCIIVFKMELQKKKKKKVLQEQMKDKMTAHQPLIEMLLAKH